MKYNRLVHYLLKPQELVVPIADHRMLDWLPDEQYLKVLYKGHMGKKLDLNNPTTYNEKLQWLKLYDHNPLYKKLVDKYAVKKYVSSKIGKQYVIPTLGIWENVNHIPFSELPEKYVLKCTHDSGSIVICNGKEKFDVSAAKTRLDKYMKHDFYYVGREWPYKELKHRIIAEEYMEDPVTDELRDYKFFCFDGKVKAMFIATDRQSENRPTAFDFYDADFNHLDIRHGHPNASVPPQKPEKFELMKYLAEILSQGIPHVRVDFYEVAGEVYFGEMTFFHHGGLVPFDPPEWDYTFGKWLKLPPKSQIID